MTQCFTIVTVVGTLFDVKPVFCENVSRLSEFICCSLSTSTGLVADAETVPMLYVYWPLTFIWSLPNDIVTFVQNWHFTSSAQIEELHIRFNLILLFKQLIHLRISKHNGKEGLIIVTLLWCNKVIQLIIVTLVWCNKVIQLIIVTLVWCNKVIQLIIVTLVWCNKVIQLIIKHTCFCKYYSNISTQHEFTISSLSIDCYLTGMPINLPGIDILYRLRTRANCVVSTTNVVSRTSCTVTVELCKACSAFSTSLGSRSSKFVLLTWKLNVILLNNRLRWVSSRKIRNDDVFSNEIVLVSTTIQTGYNGSCHHLSHHRAMMS